MLTRPAIENSKKIAKKLENTIIASFQAKIGWERRRKREKRKNCYDVFLLENTFIAFFQAKIGWERVGKRESKKSLSDVFLPDP